MTVKKAYLTGDGGGTGEVNNGVSKGTGIPIYTGMETTNLKIQTITGTGDTTVTTAAGGEGVEIFTPVTPQITLDTINRNGDTGSDLSPVLSVVQGATIFDISAGQLTFYDYSVPAVPTQTVVAYAGATGIAWTGSGTDSVTYISIDNVGVVIQSNSTPTAIQSLTQSLIGNLTHESGNLTLNFATQSPAKNYRNDEALLAYVVSKGGISLSGSVYSGVTGTTTIKKTVGTGLRFGANNLVNPDIPHYPIGPAESPIATIRYKYVDNVGSLEDGQATVNVHSVQYNNAGVLTNVPNNNWTVQKVFFAYGSNTTLVYYGNDIYNNKADAIAAARSEDWTEGAGTLDAAPRAVMIIQEGCTDTDDIAQCEFREVPGERGIASASVGAGASFYNTYQSNAVGTPQQAIANFTSGIEIEDDNGANATKILSRKSMFQYFFSTSTTASDPGNGNVRFDNVALGSANNMYISGGTEDITTVPIISNLQIGDRFYLPENASANGHILAEVTGAVVDNTGWFTVPINTESVGTSTPIDGSPVWFTPFFMQSSGAFTPNDMAGYLQGAVSQVVAGGVWNIETGTVQHNVGGGWVLDTYTVPTNGWYMAGFSGRIQYFGSGIAKWYVEVDQGLGSVERYGIVHSVAVAGIAGASFNTPAPIFLTAGQVVNLVLDNTTTSTVTVLNDRDSKIIITEVIR